MVTVSKAVKLIRRQVCTPTAAEIQTMFANRNPALAPSDLMMLAQLVAIFADVVAELAFDQREKIPTSKELLREVLLNTLPADTSPRRGSSFERHAEQPIERHVGAGLGALLNIEEGRARLTQFVQTRTLESWAGPVAGPGEIEREFHVPRSTLNEWHRRGVVIGLLRGERKHVYPLDQFVDSRPMRGIGDLVKIAPDERAAWLWLRQPHGQFSMSPPLEILRIGQRSEVIQAAELDFS